MWNVDTHGKKLLTQLLNPDCVFNICFKEGTFPDKLKLARTDPVFKRGVSSGVSWYKAYI